MDLLIIGALLRMAWMEVSGLWFDFDKYFLKSGTFLKLREFRVIRQENKTVLWKCLEQHCGTDKTVFLFMMMYSCLQNHF